jgi:hypothetical protein
MCACLWVCVCVSAACVFICGERESLSMVLLYRLCPVYQCAAALDHLSKRSPHRQSIWMWHILFYFIFFCLNSVIWVSGNWFDVPIIQRRLERERERRQLTLVSIHPTGFVHLVNKSQRVRRIWQWAMLTFFLSPPPLRLNEHMVTSYGQT